MSLTLRRVVIFVTIFISVSVGAYALIKFAQGYRPDFTKGTLQATGLLVAKSNPDAAQLLINGKLKTATNTTVNLDPGEYDIEIHKDGFFPWKKHLQIKQEIVTQVTADLFAAYPDLKVLTFTGAQEPTLSPDMQRVAYKVATASATNRGLWVLDLGDRPLGFNRDPRQIVQSTPHYDFSNAILEWSPDSKQLIVLLNKETYLLDPGRLNPAASLVDVTSTLNTNRIRWLGDEKSKQDAQITRLPNQMQIILTESAKDIRFSPDDIKVMYTATQSAQIPDDLLPQLPGASTQKQARNLEPNKIYVYDLKEDRNFYITDAPDVPAPSPTPTPKTQNLKPKTSPSPTITPHLAKTITWFPTSNHIMIVEPDKISLIEYDGNNITDVYTGPFVNTFAYPFPDANRIITLTSLGKDTPPNLYAISLR